MGLENECHPGQQKAEKGYCLSDMNDNFFNPSTDHWVYAEGTPAQHLQVFLLMMNNNQDRPIFTSLSPLCYV